MNLGFVLEVVRFIDDDNHDWMQKGGKFEHVGYMKAVFKSKKNACSYYDRHNPHMRKLNAHNTYRSDWDPTTKLMYIVREHHGINQSIDTFSIEDLPIVTIKDNVMTIQYRDLK